MRTACFSGHLYWGGGVSASGSGGCLPLGLGWGVSASWSGGPPLPHSLHHTPPFTTPRFTTHPLSPHTFHHTPPFTTHPSFTTPNHHTPPFTTSPPPPWIEWIRDRCKNITFPQLRLWAVITSDTTFVNLFSFIIRNSWLSLTARGNYFAQFTGWLSCRVGLLCRFPFSASLGFERRHTLVQSVEFSFIRIMQGVSLAKWYLNNKFQMKYWMETTTLIRISYSIFTTILVLNFTNSNRNKHPYSFTLQ